MPNILLITGRPGVGKTTLVRRLAAHVGERGGGFYTEEIREGGERTGFRLVTLDGPSAVFAQTDWRSRAPHRVSRYGVDLTALEGVGLEALTRAATGGRVVLVDEIGKMELLSDRFRETLDRVASGSVTLVATITMAPDPWAEAFKRRRGVTLQHLTRTNREETLEFALAWLAERKPSVRARRKWPQKRTGPRRTS